MSQTIKPTTTSTLREKKPKVTNLAKPTKFSYINRKRLLKLKNYKLFFKNYRPLVQQTGFNPQKTYLSIRIHTLLSINRIQKVHSNMTYKGICINLVICYILMALKPYLFHLGYSIFYHYT